jgi:hypothetical protein
MNNKTAKLVSALEEISADAKKTFGNLNAAQINWKPNGKSWSIGQCFEHLIVTNNLYFPNIQKVARGRHRNNIFSKIPFVPDLIAALMENSLFEPASSEVSATIIDDFVENQRKLIEKIEAVKDFETHKIKISEPLSAALNLRLDDAFEILAMHERRHFRQAEKVLQAESFPK